MKNILKQIPKDKNVCGAVLACTKCNFKVIMISDQGIHPIHCLDEMKMTADRTTGEWDQIYKCNSCGQIIKITKEGCGPLHCCDKEILTTDEEIYPFILEEHYEEDSYHEPVR